MVNSMPVKLGIVICIINPDGCDKIKEASSPLSDASHRISSTHYPGEARQPLEQTNVTGMRALPCHGLEPEAYDLGIDAGVFAQQVLGHKDTAGRNASSIAGVARLLVVFLGETVSPRSEFVAEERDADSAVGEKLLARRLLAFQEHWSCPHLLHLNAVGVPA
jgi:hypothetical protein